MLHLDEDNRRRYSRNIMLSEIGIEGQEKLFQSSVLIVGCGALGSVAAMYLAGSGVGRIGLIDFDTIDISNLQRQLAYGTDDIGKKKTVKLAEKIKNINSDITVECYDIFVNGKTLGGIAENYDIIIEGSDNPDTKYFVSKTSVELKKPCILGGIFRTEGQVLTYIPGHASYIDFFPVGAEAGGFTPCSLGGVLGPLPGIVASIQATEAIKILTGFGQPLIDRLLLIDAATMTFTILSI